MAPRKPAASENARRSNRSTTVKKSTDKVVKKSADEVVKKSADEVVKRPARGYHKFRNGLLNVTPKGGEKELTKNNQMSPLLRLPPEIRNEIWKYVLGGKLFRQVYRRESPRRRIGPSPCEPDNAMALLRTCRQIYAEAALMPLVLNTFSVDNVFVLKKLKPHQRKHITTIQFEIPEVEWLYKLQASTVFTYKISLPTLLPGLRKMSARVFNVPTSKKDLVQANERRVRQELELISEGLQVDLKVEQTDSIYVEFVALWLGLKTNTNTDNNPNNGNE